MSAEKTGSPVVGGTIEATDIVKTFGEQRALDGVSLHVSAGEVLGLLGPNGAGKTTLINVLATLTLPDGGTASVAGHDVVTQAAAVRQAIALTGQFAALDDMLTGRENLVLFGRLRGLSKAAALARADELLERFSLSDAATKLAGKYSGGMRRRLDLAASLVVAPQVLFLDEPTTGLDPRSRNELWDVVRELRSDGMTIVLTTQYLEEADQLAERIVVIDAGKRVAEGTPDELKTRAGGQSCVVQPVDIGLVGKLADVLASLGSVRIDDEHSVAVADCGADRLSEVIRAADGAGIDLADVLVRRPTLDEVFLQLTGSLPATESADDDSATAVDEGVGDAR